MSARLGARGHRLDPQTRFLTDLGRSPRLEWFRSITVHEDGTVYVGTRRGDLFTVDMTDFTTTYAGTPVDFDQRAIAWGRVR